MAKPLMEKTFMVTRQTFHWKVSWLSYLLSCSEVPPSYTKTCSYIHWKTFWGWLKPTKAFPFESFVLLSLWMQMTLLRSRPFWASTIAILWMCCHPCDKSGELHCYSIQVWSSKCGQILYAHILMGCFSHAGSHSYVYVNKSCLGIQQ